MVLCKGDILKSKYMYY